jgi:cellular nucleic acid-binding protein
VSIKCHRCGEVGHFSYDCVSDTPLVKLCSTCGEPGHSFIHCTNRICYNCGQVGHISNNCTSKRVRGLNRYLHDLLPKIRRHYSAFAAKDLSATQCMSCAEFGHVNCASEEADSKIGVFCPRCGSAGHTLADHIGNSRGRDTTTGGGHSNQYSGAPSGRSRSPPPSRGSRKKRTRLHQQQPLPRRPTPHVLDQQMRKKKKKKSKKTKLPPKATTTSKHYYTNRSKISKS